MNNQPNEIKTLINEDEEQLHKKRSRKRLFIALLIVDALLVAYLVYSLIFLFSHL